MAAAFLSSSSKAKEKASRLRGLLFAFLLLSPCAAVAERVYLDEEDVHARFAGNGKTWACTNGETMVGGTFSRGVGVHSLSALCLVMDGRARAFEATFGQLGKPNRSMLRLCVYRDGSLAHTSPELNATSGPHRVSVVLRGARRRSTFISPAATTRSRTSFRSVPSRFP